PRGILPLQASMPRDNQGGRGRKSLALAPTATPRERFLRSIMERYWCSAQHGNPCHVAQRPDIRKVLSCFTTIAMALRTHCSVIMVGYFFPSIQRPPPLMDC